MDFQKDNSINKKLAIHNAVDHRTMQKYNCLTVNGEPARTVDYFIYAGQLLAEGNPAIYKRSPQCQQLCKEVHKAYTVDGLSKQEIEKQLNKTFYGV